MCSHGQRALQQNKPSISPLLLQTLPLVDEDSKGEACSALDIYLAEDPSIREECVKLGVVGVLCDVLLQFATNASLREVATSALWGLSTGCAPAQVRVPVFTLCARVLFFIGLCLRLQAEVISYKDGSTLEKIVKDVVHAKDPSLRLHASGVCATVCAKVKRARGPWEMDSSIDEWIE